MRHYSQSSSLGSSVWLWDRRATKQQPKRRWAVNSYRSDPRVRDQAQASWERPQVSRYQASRLPWGCQSCDGFHRRLGVHDPSQRSQPCAVKQSRLDTCQKTISLACSRRTEAHREFQQSIEVELSQSQQAGDTEQPWPSGRCA